MNNQHSVFYGGNLQNQSFSGSPQKNNQFQQQQVNQYNPYQQNQYQQQQIGQVDMKGDVQQLVAGLGQEAQIRMQQQLAQLVINKVYKQEDEKKKKEQDANIDDGGESFSEVIFKRCCFFLDVDFYKPYFKHVTTSAVLKRIGFSMLPIRAEFFSVADNQPDMYGPLWISFSLVFALTAAGNLSMYLQSSDPTHFSYKFSFVETAFSLVFGYAIIVPIFIAFMMKLFGSHQTFYLQTICIYGYSLFVFVPVSLLCTIPYIIVQYSLFLYAALNSTFFLLNNFLNKLNELKTGDGQTDRKKIIIALIAGIQILLMFLYKYYFFQQLYSGVSKELFGDEQEINDPFSQNLPNNSTVYDFHQDNHFHRSHSHSHFNSTSQNKTLFKTLKHRRGHLLI